MAAETRTDLASLIDEFRQRAPEYSVFFAIFLAEKISKSLYPDRDDAKFDQKGLRFRPYEEYAFPSRDIRSFEFDDQTMTFVLNFFGLYGIDSPLPRCYHEQVPLQQSIHGTGKVPLQNFLDIFNTRLYWLYYQAWKKYRYYLQLSKDTSNKIFQRIFAFTGQLGQSAETTDWPSQFKKFRLSSVLSHRVRNKMGLLILLKEHFPRFGFRIQEFVPRRVLLEEPPKLGSRQGDRPFQLSRYNILGRSVLDWYGRIRVEIGPLNFDEYLDFTPDTENAALLNDLLQLYLHDGLEYDIKFRIRSDTIGRIPWNDRRLGLGVSMWLGRPGQEIIEIDYPYERFSRTHA
jgi:type VI secretion system protein ImpH